MIRFALKRLIQLENTFLNRPLYSEAYRKFIYEYDTLGHMTKVGMYPADVMRDSFCWYIRVCEKRIVQLSNRIATDSIEKSQNRMTKEDYLMKEYILILTLRVEE